MKKILFMFIAALAFVSCGSDDDTKSSDSGSTVSVPDYSKYIDMSYTDMSKALGTPTATNGEKVKYYVYANPENNVASISVGVNPDNNKVFVVTENFVEDAFSTSQLQSYFASKYTSYGKNSDGDYVYGNTAKEADATLAIFQTGNSYVIYNNPNNTAEEQMGTISGTPVEVVNELFCKSVSDVIAKYPNTLFNFGNGNYTINYKNDTYLSLISMTSVLGVINSISIDYNKSLTDAKIISYYEGEGYTCGKTDTDDGEGHSTYLFINEKTGIKIIYCNLQGVIMAL